MARDAGSHFAGIDLGRHGKIVLTADTGEVLEGPGS